MSSRTAFVAAVLVANLPLPIQAHDIYLDVVDGAGQSCCDNRDCRPAHYRIKGGGVQMFVYGHWLVIPHDKIQYRSIQGDTGETAGGHWCGQGQQGSNYIFYATHCAILPPQAANAGLEWLAVSGQLWLPD
jgi:hypothetical protein